MAVNPSPLFSLNGGAPGVKASVSSGATVTATLDDTAGVYYVEWSIIATDETTSVGDYALSVAAGVVPGAESTELTADGAGTAGCLKARINHGLSRNGLVDETLTTSTAKWYVPTAGAGYEVGTVRENDESDATFGWTGIINTAIRASGLFAAADVEATPNTIAQRGASGELKAASMVLSALGKLTIGGLDVAANNGSFTAFGASATPTVLTGSSIALSSKPVTGGASIAFASATTPAITQTQAASGTGATMSITAQQGFNGSRGGTLSLAAGNGGTISDAPGDVDVNVKDDGTFSGNMNVKSTNFGTILQVRYDGSEGTAIVESPQDSCWYGATGDVSIYAGSYFGVNLDTSTSTVMLQNNVALGNTPTNFAGGSNVVFIANGTAPGSNAAGGVYLYSEAGVLKARTPTGITPLAL